MKCKVFNIRIQNFGLQKLGTATDEEKLNEFLENNSVINYYATLVNSSTTFWSILIFYEEYNDAGEQYIDNAAQHSITHNKEIFANLRKIESK